MKPADVDARIVFNRCIHGGQPCLNESRLTVQDVVFKVKHDGLAGFFADYDYYTRDHVASAIMYCRERRCLKDKPPIFCSNCVYYLEMQNMTPEEGLKSNDVVCTKDSDSGLVPGKYSYFLGTTADLLESLKGEERWKTAEELYQALKQELELPDSYADLFPGLKLS